MERDNSKLYKEMAEIKSEELLKNLDDLKDEVLILTE